MKIITEQYFHSIVDSIIKEKEKEAELLHQSFTGISCDNLWAEVDKYVGDGKWAVKKEQPVKFTRADINAVASARFYRKTGIQLLMGMVIIVLALSAAVKYIPNMTELYYNIFYTLCGVVALSFIYVYSHKQSKVRKELWKQIGREEKEEK